MMAKHHPSRRSHHTLSPPPPPSSPFSILKSFHTLFLLCGFVLLCTTFILPWYLLSHLDTHDEQRFPNNDHHHGVKSLVIKHQQDIKEQRIQDFSANDIGMMKKEGEEEKKKSKQSQNEFLGKNLIKNETIPKVVPRQKTKKSKKKEEKPKKKFPHLISKTLTEDDNDTQPQPQEEEKEEQSSPLARGVAGLPLSQTPALINAQRGKIKCDVDANSLAYWNQPQGTRDVEFASPFAVPDGHEKYISFETDIGGWNNIRISLENIFVIALATNRTLVLPPKQQLYLLTKDKSDENRGLADFFPIHTPYFQNRLKVITMKDFLTKEGGIEGKLPIQEDKRDLVLAAQSTCIWRNKSETSCMRVHDHLHSVGTLPGVSADDCFVFDTDVYHGQQMTTDHADIALDFCAGRKMLSFTSTLQNSTLIHFPTSTHGYRFLDHFYGLLHFTDPAIDNHYKRFVRDYMHYTDPVFCAASKIVRALQNEGKRRGFDTDNEQGGAYSSLHVRRGDLQFKDEVISAQEWYNNTRELWEPNEILYISTDERNKTFFDPMKQHYDLRFLDDYWDVAGLGDVDPNYMGMIDTIVASRGRIFVGTYFSTFSGYINRMRGYHGMSMKDSYYGSKKYKYALQEWRDHVGDEFSHEWPSGWIGIDGDAIPSRDKF